MSVTSIGGQNRYLLGGPNDPKIFPFFIITMIVFFITFDVVGTHAQVGTSWLTANPVTPQPTHMPYDQKLFFGSFQKLSTVFSTNTSANPPVRGALGDWWADVVIGQPDFTQITPNEVVGNKLFNPGGVYVDRSIIPNRVYVYDAGNSRILGFSSLGACTAGVKAGQNCTSNSDCPGSSCTINSSRPADIVLGQPSPNLSACNGDSGFQNYPDYPMPTASTLCGLRPGGASILEGGSMATMATDAQGNLYHPDYFNNRILRYNNPFNSDAAADYVWGQTDFNHGTCNEGRSYGSPDNNSLCLMSPPGYGSVKSGVAVDTNGNLWVADTHNNRVLRFPYSSATRAPAKVANLVLGQSNFTSAVAGDGLNRMMNPSSVRVDASGNVYVLDGIDGSGTQGRLLVFIPPLSNGMAASQVFNRAVEPTGLELDTSDQLLINESDSQQILRLANGEIQPMIANVPNGSWGGLGIDRDGNIMLTGWNSQEVQIYSAPSYGWTSTFLQADDYGFFNQLGPHGMTDPGGLEVTGDQLIVADNTRLLFWNNLTQLTSNYPPADGVIGQPDFVTRPRWGLRYGRMRADTHAKLWVLKGDVDIGTNILAYQLPLQSQAEPVIEIASPLPLKGGGSFSWSGSLDLGGIAYQPECDCLWLSDTTYSRVFRINQVNSPNRFVDIVLGQKSAAGIHCNQGRDSDDGYAHPQFPSQDSLCHPGALAFDKRGNLFVSDHNLEVAGNWRLLEYDAAGLQPNPSTAVFGLPASKVYGRNGSFTEPNCQADDPICGPWEPVFYPNNDMVIGFNTYLGPPFPQVYHDPLINSLPYAALGDYYSHAYSARLDSLNNLYILDGTRNHVLIYRATYYTISGNVGASGTTLHYTIGIPKTTLADSSGHYSISVPLGWSGTITPTKKGYTFSPQNKTYSNIQSNQAGQNYTVQYTKSADTTGVFRPSNGLLYLKNTNETGFADIALNYGLPGDYPVVGDWDGNGIMTIGVYRNGYFYLRNSNTIGFAEVVFPFGQPGDQPVAGDWNNDGIDTIGVYRGNTFYLRDSNSAGPVEKSFSLGNAGDVGIAGDWNGDGMDTTGVFRPSNGYIYLKNTNETGFADWALNYGLPGDKPVTGDWDNDGVDTIGVYRGNTFYLRNENTNGFAEIVFSLGNPGDMPIAGNWDGLP